MANTSVDWSPVAPATTTGDDTPSTDSYVCFLGLRGLGSAVVVMVVVVVGGACSPPWGWSKLPAGGVCKDEVEVVLRTFRGGPLSVGAMWT